VSNPDSLAEHSLDCAVPSNPLCSPVGHSVEVLYFPYMKERTILCCKCKVPIRAETASDMKGGVFIVQFLCNCTRQEHAETESRPLTVA